MKSKIYVREELSAFIIHASNFIPPSTPFEEIQIPCPHCSVPVCYPVVVRQRDIEIMEELISAAQEYLCDQGVQEKMFAEIINKLKRRLIEKGSDV